MGLIISIMQSPITLLALGAIVKFFPVVRVMIANRLIPMLNIIVALVGGLLALATGAVAVPDAVPSGFVAAVMQGGADLQSGFVSAGFFSFVGREAGGFFGALGGALGSAAQAYVLNKITLNQYCTRPADSRR